MSEFFDVLDCARRKTGEIILRSEAHRKGVWHGAFHCLIIYERAGQNYALFQKRSPNKKIAPHRFDVSVGGHYLAGEDAAAAGQREIKEELGLDIPFADLFPVGRRIFVYGLTQGIIEYEFQDVYFLPRRLEPGSLSLQREELDGILEMAVNDGIKLFSHKIQRMVCSFYPSDSSEKKTLSVSADDFVFCIDNYYLKLLLLAQRYLYGDRELLII